MKLRPFHIERYFAKYEFTTKYHLSSSDCESMPLSDLLKMGDRECIDLWNKLTLSYTEATGHPKLRQEIAKMYKGINQDDIITVVPEEGIFLLMHALLEPEDHVVCIFPAYQSLYEIARSIGCEVSNWEIRKGYKKAWTLDLNELERLLRPNTKLVVINFPHNPTGYMPSRDKYFELIALLKERNIMLLSDEMYRFIEVDQDSPLPSACELYDLAFTLFGLSKSFGLPGLRSGWLVTKDHKELDKITLLKDYTTICASSPAEILSIIALRNREQIIQAQMKRIHRNMKILDCFFEKYNDIFLWKRPNGGSICFPKLLLPENATQFSKEIIEKTGVMILPGRSFLYKDDHIRIGFGRENLPEVIEVLSNYIDKRY